MTIFLMRTYRLIEKYGWKMSLMVLTTLFIFGWAMMSALEPAESDLTDFSIYSWWFIVTTTTVGYGDYSPQSPGGRLAAVIIMMGGIGSIGIVITQLTALGAEIRRIVMEGSANFTETNHVVILGYHPEKTENLVNEIHGDENWGDKTIILCFDTDQCGENPMPDIVKPVKGKLTSSDVLERACVKDADRIICDGRDDNETLIIALAVCDINKTAHVVAAVENLEESQKHILKIDKAIECVPADIVTMIVQALQDPGITRLYSRFLSNLEGHSGYRVNIPINEGSWTYGDMFVYFKKNLNATLLALVESHDYEAPIIENPPWDHPVKGGMSLYYVAERRLTNIEFESIK